MTRVNVVPASSLCDQHLLAEHREITRIPNEVLRIVKSGKPVRVSIEKSYHLGKGHVLFFRDKLGWLHKRYTEVHRECERRGFKVSWIWPAELHPLYYTWLYNDYTVTRADRELNYARILERMPASPRYYGETWNFLE